MLAFQNQEVWLFLTPLKACAGLLLLLQEERKKRESRTGRKVDKERKRKKKEEESKRGGESRKGGKERGREEEKIGVQGSKKREKKRKEGKQREKRGEQEREENREGNGERERKQERERRNKGEEEKNKEKRERKEEKGRKEKSDGEKGRRKGERKQDRRRAEEEGEGKREQGAKIKVFYFVVWLHRLGTDQAHDTCLYHEKDDIFSLDLRASESKKYLFVASESKTTRFVFYLDISKIDDGLLALTQRVNGIETYASHRGNHFFIQRKSDECFNSELIACPVENISATSALLPHRPSIKIQEMQLFSDHLAVYERENGLPKITVYRLPAAGEPLEELQGGRVVDFVDPIYSVDPSESQFSSSILRFFYSSLKTPPSVYDYDMDTGVSVLKKIDPVLGGFDSSNYVTERQQATASDGTEIPISITYKKNLVKLDGSDPLLLYGYGSYEVCIDPYFKASRLSLLDRGFIYAIAHIRGGGEMGRQWYENGKLLKKKNTFTDFIACAEHLIEKKYCNKEKLCINAVAEVPFVDILTTMLDPTIPLTTSEWEEWGDPRKEEYYFYMKSYSPVDNVKPQCYPAILLTTGLYDPRVLYSEPAKFVAKLRDMKTDDNMLLFKCECSAGHFSKSGRFEKLKEVAFTYAFMLKALNMIPSPGSKTN
nr:oligopeptidase B [Ipomoea batatas]